MSYVDAIYIKEKNKIQVVERINGQRVYNSIPVDYIFYHEHPSGTHTSIFGDPCKKFISNDFKKFNKELRKTEASGIKTFESDINPIFRALENNYKDVDAPVLNIGFFDIEVNFSPEHGFAQPNDPFNEITAISVYLAHAQTLVTLVLCPPTYTKEEARFISDKFENTFLFTDEKELLLSFIDIIDDIDVFSGWNSEGYDIPYIVNRIIRVLGEDYTRKLCLWDSLPRKKEVEKFKKKFNTYELVGRVHLDYLLLYQKHNTQQLHSYRLDFVGEVEVGENKTPYSGTLDQLYKEDFGLFIEYNRQDVMLLVKIDEKRKLIELSNQVAHANSVLLKNTLGSVALVEQAIINEIHALGLVVPNKPKREFKKDLDDDDDDSDDDNEHTAVAGAYVVKPKVGIHDEIGSVDLTSLYPSTIRALNLSPETVVGQIRPDYTDQFIKEKITAGAKGAEPWDGLFGSLEYQHVMSKSGTKLIVDYEDGSTEEISARNLHDYIFNKKNNLCISANGTIFKTDKDGIIPYLLSKWFNQRKDMQKTMKEFKEKAENESDKKKKEEYKKLALFWDQRQLARKILLNSLYGALLNPGLRFYDKRMGQSVTLTGRCIAKHMGAEVNRVITGEYDNVGRAIIYGDTDSVYFSAYHILKNDERYKDFEWSRDNIISLYDAIGDAVNETFPEFMDRSFNTGITRGKIISAGREIVASKGLFIKKKKYACLVYDDDGIRMDTDGKPGKLKAMGLDLKRADTPKYMQEFLEKILLGLLQSVDRDILYGWIKNFRDEFRTKPGWEKGTPKAVKALTNYTDQYNKAEARSLMETSKIIGKVNLPGHVRAAMNWNNLCETFDDRYAMRIGDGAKTIVCKLKPNLLKIDSVAYPIDEPHLPEWFKKLPFDHDAMEDTIIDKKLSNIVGVLDDWDLKDTKNSSSDQFFVF